MFRVFQHRTSGTHFLELFADGLLCFVAALLSAATLAQSGSTYGLIVQLATPGILLSALAFALVMALLYSFVGLYRHRNLGLLAMIARVAFTFVVGGYTTYLTIKYIAYDGYASRLVGLALVYLLAGLAVYRGLAFAVRQYIGTRRVLIVGTGPDAQQVWNDLRAGEQWSSHEVVGFVPTAEQGATVAPRAGVTVFDSRRRLVDLVREQRVSEIIVAVREQRGGGVPMDQLLDCRISGVPIMDLAAFYERTKAEVPVDSLKASWLVYGDGFVQGRLRQASKRLFDIVSSSFLLILGAPVMLLTALAIRLDSPGPVLYRQERVGLGGRGFQCIKFRSMRTDAEKDGVARWATKNDSRITRVGAFIRKTRIDELPQLFSVLAGEMSMVGPRPERPSFVAQLREQIPYYDLRHTVKPGLTGWAQVRYAYGASLEDARKKHQFDLYYVKNNSVLLDLQVLIETVSVVLFREGAH
ncbi:MAG TPA: TIGR03013 family PEP-CTERM/XrtA system glycosyltransferase [Burkholderiaceae bacterium]|nr:TIGR03013 family PEP-CTERM/XrtA system glycosyltransferase [Burkholderiaceae bacterium]HMX10035.1 TIGR03013 family PEP-CTERM/XrtA system glycosyltransferase [Burkholderiaceae bacterium]HMY98308.1 TIGR03013 family PEP-CTERM/XrtA system glycosyltransferase [Burkholderiaceae bacterium]HNB42757.1 TIGR03013 family PEP-CTERM/XrtA system glycosyltransferase [Burkholderiaceae bacterium]HNG77899.1 TIGR03013 family PEP-CTERM/XrtA system glycosyltransferase [Burkholderiaceae bacterium]